MRDRSLLITRQPHLILDQLNLAQLTTQRVRNPLNAQQQEPSNLPRFQGPDGFLKHAALHPRSINHIVRAQGSCLDMGQHLSVLKKFRDARRDAQVLGASHGFAEQSPSPEDEPNTSSSDEMQGIRSSLKKTSSEVWHTDRELKPGSTPTTLLRLPTELILNLAQYLPPSAYMSFSYSCRNVRDKLSASIAHVLGDKVIKDLSFASPPSVELRNTRSLERMELRSLLDRDGQIPRQNAFCSGCGYAHDSSRFSLASLSQPRDKRRCLGRAGQAWICPHRTIDYHQATSYGQTQDSHKCGSCWVLVDSTYPGYGFDTCLTDWPIMRVPRDGVLSNEEVKEALGRLGAATCPHLRLDDACVASVYHQDCRKLRWNSSFSGSAPDCRCSNCPLNKFCTVVCSFCGTGVLFRIKGERNGTETLRLLVTRTFREVWSCTDPAWICHLAEPADFEEYDREWQASSAECWRRVVSDLDAFLGFEVGAND